MPPIRDSVAAAKTQTTGGSTPARMSAGQLLAKAADVATAPLDRVTRGIKDLVTTTPEERKAAMDRVAKGEDPLSRFDRGFKEFLKSASIKP